MGIQPSEKLVGAVHSLWIGYYHCDSFIDLPHYKKGLYMVLRL